MKSRKFLSMLLGISMMISVTACGNDNTGQMQPAAENAGESTPAESQESQESTEAADPAQVQKITMWSNDQHDQAIIDEKIQQFNETIGKEKGIEVEYTVYGSDYYSTLDVAVSAGEGPDIFKCY